MKTVKLIPICTALLVAATACMAAGQVRGPRAPKPSAPALNAPANDREAQWWGPRPGARPVAHGTVAHVDANRIDVKTNRAVMQFVVNEQTKVIVRGEPGRITDVKTDDVVNVKFQKSDTGAMLALGVMVPKSPVAPKERVRGKVESVQGNVLLVTTKEDKQVSVTLTGETKILSRRYIGTTADLKVGYRVIVGGDESAAKVVEFMPLMARGAVTAVNGDVITVKTVDQRVIELQASAATAVLVRPRVGANVPGTIADVKVGLPVNIGYHAAQGTAPLLWIDVLTGA